MKRSRVTFAMIEAMATAGIFSSPFMMVFAFFGCSPFPKNNPPSRNILVCAMPRSSDSSSIFYMPRFRREICRARNVHPFDPARIDASNGKIDRRIPLNICEPCLALFRGKLFGIFQLPQLAIRTKRRLFFKSAAATTMGPASEPRPTSSMPIVYCLHIEMTPPFFFKNPSRESASNTAKIRSIGCGISISNFFMLILFCASRSRKIFPRISRSEPENFDCRA